jgi:hypothetical protein
MSTFTAKALGEYLCISEDVVKHIIASTFTPMNPAALTEGNISLLFTRNSRFIGNLDEFISWYYLEYSVDEIEAADKRYALIQDHNWKQAMGW